MKLSHSADSIALASRRALSTLVEREWQAYPESLLPYPKEQIKAALKSYLRDHPELSDEERALVRVQYIFLAEFVVDEEAVLVNTADLQLNPDMLFKDAIDVVSLPEDYLKRCAVIRQRQDRERRALTQDIMQY